MKKYIFLITAILLAGTAVLQAQDQKFKTKILVSSAGQSADTKLVGMVLKKLKLSTSEVLLAKPSDLTGIETLILVPGFSSKGLGAAGISIDQETARVKELIQAAKQKNIPVICIHIGGTARRKGNSDEFNKMVADVSKYIIVVKQGDEDKFFTNIGSGKKIPVKVVEKIAEISDELNKLFN
ncbi:MAG: hypothetical protein HRU80_08135 [Ignavibacteriales bacterium]|nr:MAG: hypothetical protein HRU80_08135 [Ignavibacteriales bacterium]